MSTWTTADIPSQTGRSAVITGTGGLALEDALALARAGADVILAGRSADKGAAAVERVRAAVAGAAVRFEQVDLANLRSVADFTGRLLRQRSSLDLLINNAAVMTPPKREETADGLELQLGTNSLAHFALTAGLLPLLRKGKGARVVWLSSIAARDARIDFDDLQSRTGYAPMRAYGQSKLACLLYAFEMQRRSQAGSWGVTSVAAHPGIARTDLLLNAPGRRSAVGVARTLLWFLFQPAARGAESTLFAATSPDAQGGAYYGPRSLGETRGAVGPATVPANADDTSAAARLWRVSEEATGVAFG